ncbi:MAG: hypothetical protein U1F71_07505 [Verrucomicrobiaceae bacterium]
MNYASPAHSRWKALLLLAFVFMLGAACGIGGGLLVVRRIAQHAITHPGGENAPMDRASAHIESLIASDLDLTAEERAAVHTELQKTASDFKALRAEVWQKTTVNLQDMLDRIAKHLPPEKQSRLREQAAKRLKPWGLMSEPK